MLTNHTLILLAGVCVLAGCASLAEEFARKAAELRFTREVVRLRAKIT